jgi:hypothetical protein
MIFGYPIGFVQIEMAAVFHGGVFGKGKAQALH